MLSTRMVAKAKAFKQGKSNFGGKLTGGQRLESN
jgi:hypothetical protein